jgi:hypothetical protein
MRDMTMKLLTKTVACAMLAYAGTDIAQAGSSPVPRWTMQVHAEEGYDDFKVTDLNNSGQMTGHTSITAQPWSLQFGFITDGMSNTIFDTGEDQYFGQVINEAGVAAGYSNGSDQLVRFEVVDGVPTVTELAFLDSNSFTPKNMKINEAGMITGRIPQGAGVYQAFQWTPDTGMQEIMTGSNANVMDMNEAGAVVGQSSEGAFYYLDGDLEMLPGSVALSIDEAGRVLLRTGSETAAFSMYDLSTGEQEAIISGLPLSWAGTIGYADESGRVVITWMVDEQAHMATWSSEHGLNIVEVPDSWIACSNVLMNEAGEAIVGVLDEEYITRYFFSHGLHNNGGFTDITKRVFDFCGQYIYSVVDFNDAGQIALQLGIELNLEHTAILSMARPGDTNGDGTVGVNDLLAVIGNWGEWIAEDDCGGGPILPDLDGDGHVNVTDLLICIGDWD